MREKIGNAMALVVLVLIGMMALMGPSGVLAWSDDEARLDEYRERIARLEEERAVLENRVELLDPNHVDADLASELVRRDLNVVHPDEYVFDLGQQP